MRLQSLLFMGWVACLAIAAVSYAEKPADPWLVIPGKQAGALKAESSETDLIKIYGKENVIRHGYYIAEGFCEPGTILFPKDDKRRLEITWGDRKQNRYPLNIQWFNPEKGKSQWHLPEGITTGTPLAEVQKFNRKPFRIGGLGWDYGGYVLSWEHGQMEKIYPDITVRFMESNLGNYDATAYEKIAGEGAKFWSNSKNPIVKSLVVSRLVTSFPGNVTRFPSDGSEQKDCRAFGELR